jgi:hypothetical protein
MNGLNQIVTACTNLGISLEKLIASVAIFACPNDVDKIVQQFGDGRMYTNVRRGKKGEPRRTHINGEYIDENTFVGRSFKNGFKNLTFDKYTVCHIWDLVHNVNYFSEIRNLVLIPSGLHALSDNIPFIIDMLRYRAWELYGWSPNGVKPMKPANYPSPSDWAQCEPFALSSQITK